MHYATLFRSDGEAMCLALAECRGWTVATDDRRAIQVAQKAGLSVVSCPELVKAWADATRPDATSLVQVLTDIQTLAQFRPNPTMAAVPVVDQCISQGQPVISALSEKHSGPSALLLRLPVSMT